MFKIFFVLAIIFVGFYFRSRYDKKYVIPILAENKNLAKLKKITLGLIVIALLSFMFKLIKLAFIIMILLIPIVLFMNYQIYRLANSKYKLEKLKK